MSELEIEIDKQWDFIMSTNDYACIKKETFNYLGKKNEVRKYLTKWDVTNKHFVTDELVSEDIVIYDCTELLYNIIVKDNSENDKNKPNGTPAFLTLHDVLMFFKGKIEWILQKHFSCHGVIMEFDNDFYVSPAKKTRSTKDRKENEKKQKKLEELINNRYNKTPEQHFNEHFFDRTYTSMTNNEKQVMLEKIKNDEKLYKYNKKKIIEIIREKKKYTKYDTLEDLFNDVNNKIPCPFIDLITNKRRGKNEFIRFVVKKLTTDPRYQPDLKLNEFVIFTGHCLLPNDIPKYNVPSCHEEIYEMEKKLKYNMVGDNEKKKYDYYMKMYDKTKTTPVIFFKYLDNELFDFFLKDDDNMFKSNGINNDNNNYSGNKYYFMDDDEQEEEDVEYPRKNNDYDPCPYNAKKMSKKNQYNIFMLNQKFENNIGESDNMAFFMINQLYENERFNKFSIYSTDSDVVLFNGPFYLFNFYLNNKILEKNLYLPKIYNIYSTRNNVTSICRLTSLFEALNNHAKKYIKYDNSSMDFPKMKKMVEKDLQNNEDEQMTDTMVFDPIFGRRANAFKKIQMDDDNKIDEKWEMVDELNDNILNHKELLNNNNESCLIDKTDAHKELPIINFIIMFMMLGSDYTLKFFHHTISLYIKVIEKYHQHFFPFVEIEYDDFDQEDFDLSRKNVVKNIKMDYEKMINIVVLACTEIRGHTKLFMKYDLQHNLNLVDIINVLDKGISKKNKNIKNIGKEHIEYKELKSIRDIYKKAVPSIKELTLFISPIEYYIKLCLQNGFGDVELPDFFNYGFERYEGKIIYSLWNL